jgi:tetratricopeptide (TPR) repeat protein
VKADKTDHHERDYWCFISYRHADNRGEGRKWASWLHRELETYEVPADLVGTTNDRGDKIPARIYPVFRDEEELPADAELSAPIERALRRSRSLVVICSPAARASRFVEDEVRLFKAIDKADRVLAMIISGEPNVSESAAVETDRSAQECFPLSLRRVVDSDGRVTDELAEPVAADFRLADGSEGWTSPAGYRKALQQAGTPRADADKLVGEYETRSRLMKLKIVAGILGIPLGVLTKRDQVYELEKAKKRARVLRRWLVVVSIAMITAVVAGTIALWQWREAERATHRALAARSQAEELIEFMTFKMRDNLSSIGRLDLLDQINSEVEKYNLSKAAASETLGGHQSAKEIYRTAANLTAQGDSLKAKGQFSKAYEIYRQALELDKQAIALEPENLHFVHGLSVVSAKLGDCAEQLGDLFMADVYYKHCVATRRDLVDREPDNPRWSLELAKGYRARASLLAGEKKLQDAENEARLAQRSLDKIQSSSSSNPDYMHGRASNYSLLGTILAQKEAFSDAQKAYEEVLSIASQLCKADPANVNWQQALSVANGKLARLAVQTSDFAEATKYFSNALEIDRKLSEADPLNNDRAFSVFLTEESLGGVAEKSGNQELALAQYQKAVVLLDKLLTAKDGDSNFLWLIRSAQISGTIRDLLQGKGKESEAVQWNQRAQDHEAKAQQVWKANQKLSE